MLQLQRKMRRSRKGVLWYALLPSQRRLLVTVSSHNLSQVPQVISKHWHLSGSIGPGMMMCSARRPEMFLAVCLGCSRSLSVRLYSISYFIRQSHVCVSSSESESEFVNLMACDADVRWTGRRATAVFANEL
jgi:hypothetical protein